MLLGAGRSGLESLEFFLARILPPLRGAVLLAGGLILIVGVLNTGGWPQDNFLVLGILLGRDLLFGA